MAACFVVNLAYSLSNTLKKRVGIFDADVYGSSIPTLLGLAGTQIAPVSAVTQPHNAPITPPKNIGIECMSLDFVAARSSPTQPFVWRGLIVMKALEHLLRNTKWTAIDYLIVDMPPGTGDIQLTIAQKLKVDAALIVTTPQHVAMQTAQKGAEMLKLMGIRILGNVQNMLFVECAKCGHKNYLHAPTEQAPNGEKMADKILAQIPHDPRLSRACDVGEPYTVLHRSSEVAHCFDDLAEKVVLLTHHEVLQK